MRKITTINELTDWIFNNFPVSNLEAENNSIYFQAPNNSSITIDYDEDDNIDEIILKAIETLESFDADNQFMDLWNVEFAEHNHFKPSQFIKMLQEDEKTFKELAGELEELKGSINH